MKNSTRHFGNCKPFCRFVASIKTLLCKAESFNFRLISLSLTGTSTTGSRTGVSHTQQCHWYLGNPAGGEGQETPWGSCWRSCRHWDTLPTTDRAPARVKPSAECEHHFFPQKILFSWSTRLKIPEKELWNDRGLHKKPN